MCEQELGWLGDHQLGTEDFHVTFYLFLFGSFVLKMLDSNGCVCVCDFGCDSL